MKTIEKTGVDPRETAPANKDRRLGTPIEKNPLINVGQPLLEIGHTTNRNTAELLAPTGHNTTVMPRY